MSAKHGVYHFRNHLAAAALVSAATLTLSACGSSSGSGGSTTIAGHKAPYASVLYDSFSAGSLSGAKWYPGQYQAVLQDKQALLSVATSAKYALPPAGMELDLTPPSGGQVTSVQADVVVDSATSTGTVYPYAAIDLDFWPLAKRLNHPSDTGRLFGRLYLQWLEPDLVAGYEVIECTPDDCSAAQLVGTRAGSWIGVDAEADTPVSLGTTYTTSVSVDPSKEQFTFSISGGTLKPMTETLDLTSVTSPFAPDLSVANFHRARLLTEMVPGASGGDGAITAHFDNVMVGVGGATPTLFDDFNTGTTFDTSKWNVGGETAQISGSPAALQMGLDQADLPASATLDLVATTGSALQADVTVTNHNSTGTGKVAAGLRQALYNDGSNGSGTPPDINEAKSDVGDVIAALLVTDTDVFYTVFRCDSAFCDRATFIQPFTSLGAVTLGSTHTVYMDWNSADHVVLFQLDGKGGAAFDPTGTNPVHSTTPNFPIKSLVIRAGDTSATDHFTTGSVGSMRATFANVKTN